MISKNDYNELLDREIISFIDETESWFPNDGGELSVLEQRSHYDRMCEAFKAPRPENVETVTTLKHQSFLLVIAPVVVSRQPFLMPIEIQPPA